MSTAMTTLKRWQDGYVTAIARIEGPVVEYTGRAAESVAGYVPDRPHWTWLDEVPTLTELVDNQLKFRRRVIDQQAAFVRRMLKAMHPALTHLESKAPAATRAATKPTPIRRVGAKVA